MLILNYQFKLKFNVIFPVQCTVYNIINEIKALTLTGGGFKSNCYNYEDNLRIP